VVAPIAAAAAMRAEMSSYARSRYRQLNACFRAMVHVVAALIVFSWLLALLDALFSTTGIPTSNGISSSASIAAPATSSFAVVINTYKRPDRLREAVLHYAGVCGTKYKVGQVFVVWSERGVDPPALESFFSPPDEVGVRGGQSSTHIEKGNGAESQSRRSEVAIIVSEKDSLNSRFLPIKDLRTDTIFMVDDDVRVDCSSLLHGFRAWQSSPNSMVGYYPRLASPSLFSSASHKSDAVGGKRLVYHTFPVVYLRGLFNMVLTKACFLHSKYLDLYSGDVHPRKIRDYVDQHKNCEDVAMSLLVANATRSADAAPIYVEGLVTDTGLFGGISTGTGHMRTRSDCLDDIAHIYAEHGWDMSLIDVPLSERSWLRHYPGWRYQIRPSNFFEWLSFGNLLT